MKSLRGFIIFSIVLLSIISCQQEPGNLNSLKERMMANGYAGEYWQPNSKLERMALTLIGVDDLLVYNDDYLNAFVFKIKEGKDPEKALAELESYVREQVTFNVENGDQSKEVTWQQIKDDAKIRGQYLLLWFGENEEDLLRVFRFF
ncbi:MAG: hypothetical protein V2I46_10940 [Bacteroides sp.]|jgi:hypothetical protein|nr:hypothetical protein [Bacteroides sp.]